MKSKVRKKSATNFILDVNSESDGSLNFLVFEHLEKGYNVTSQRLIAVMNPTKNV